MTRFVFDGWMLESTSGELSRGETITRLQEQPLLVLLLLLDRAGEVVTREQLIAHLWPKVIVDFETGLNAVVRRLRIALGDEADKPRYIETIPRKGYRFIGTVESAEVSSHASQTLPAAEARKRKFAVRWALTAATVVMAIGFGGLLLSYEPGAFWNQPPPIRIAVLPFQNMSPDESAAFFADGMHEEIISTLAMRAAALEVVPRTTMMMYRAAPLQRAAGELAATHLLEGSVRKDGSSVRLTVKLIEARSQRYVWSNSYDRELVDALSLQAAVAGDIASQLAVSLAPNSPESITADPDAYEAYLKARLAFRDGDWRRAEEYASEAIRRDASFGAAYAIRAVAGSMEIVFNLDTTEARLQQEFDDLEAARRLLGDNDPQVLIARAYYAGTADRDYARSQALHAAAEAAGLKDPTAMRSKAMLLVVTDRLDEAIAAHRSLAALDPGNFVLVNFMAILLSLAHQPDEALRISELVVERFAGNADAKLTRSRIVFAHSGRTNDWREVYENELPSLSLDRRVLEQFDLLRYERRFDELQNALQMADVEAVSAGTFNSLTLCCVGTRPLAEYRGWTALLQGDGAAAGAEGRAILEFVARQTPNRWNDWYLRLLEAEGLLLEGRRERALVGAREALSLVPRHRNAVNWRYAAAISARIFAWGGASADAVALLEQLDAARPGLSPAEIGRDPLYQVPLSESPQYEALVERLEGQMTSYGARFR